MNLIRSVMSVFLVVLVGLSVAGWVWAGGQSSANMAGARFVLALCGLFAVGALSVLWTTKRPVPN